VLTRARIGIHSTAHVSARARMPTRRAACAGHSYNSSLLAGASAESLHGATCVQHKPHERSHMRMRLSAQVMPNHPPHYHTHGVVCPCVRVCVCVNVTPPSPPPTHTHAPRLWGLPCGQSQTTKACTPGRCVGLPPTVGRHATGQQQQGLSPPLVVHSLLVGCGPQLCARGTAATTKQAAPRHISHPAWMALLAAHNASVHTPPHAQPRPTARMHSDGTDAVMGAARAGCCCLHHARCQCTTHCCARHTNRHEAPTLPTFFEVTLRPRGSRPPLERPCLHSTHPQAHQGHTHTQARCSAAIHARV
jgi:hypothetical protein